MAHKKFSTMKFRYPAALLLSILTGFFSWSLLCTWKRDQLEKKERLENPGLEDYSAFLCEKYDAKHGGVWSLPFIGPISYKHISSISLRRGGDMAGKHLTTVGVDYATFLEKTCHENEVSEVKEQIQAAEAAWKKDGSQSLLAHFCKQVEEKNLHRFFDGKCDIDSTYNKKAMEKALLQHANESMKHCHKVLEQRLNPQGLGSYEMESVTTSGEHQIVISASITESEKDLTHLIENPGELGFYKRLNQNDYLYKTSKKNLNSKIEEAQDKQPGNKNQTLIKEDSLSPYCLEVDKEAILEASIEALKHKNVLLSFQKREDSSGINRYYLLFLQKDSKHEFKIEKAIAEKSTDPKDHGSHILRVTLAEQHKKEMESFSENLHDTQHHLAIVLDGEVITTANVGSKLTNMFTISGVGTRSQAEDLGIQLKSGALPVKLKQIKRDSISASLGEMAQKKGFRSILWALLLVLLFMMFYYAIGGLLANVALLFNVIFTLGALAQFGATLTLPGIASLVFTIGISIDSNVIIFESIRDELRNKMSMREAVKRGFQNSYRSLIDSNITTMLTGIILYYFGSGAIRGFATTLLIGIVASALTSVILSRLLIDAFIHFFGEERISFAFSFSRNTFSNFKVNFISKRKFAYLFSLIFLGSGIGLACHQGLDWGIEFTGGSTYDVRFAASVSPEDITEGIEGVFKQKAESKGIKQGTLIVTSLDSTKKRYKIKTNFGKGREDIQVEKLVQKGISTGTSATFIGSQALLSDEEEDRVLEHDEWTMDSSMEVKGTSAKEKLQKAKWAVLFALIMMLLYIFLSFNRFSFAVSALAALVHDTLALFSCLAFAKLVGWRYDVDFAFILTILTVIGYSVNDTIVIFNTIRQKMMGKDILDSETANAGINKTLSRTLITSLTTLIPVLVLFLFGGIALESLAFSLFFGILWGTYSSIFIATPLAHDVGLLQKKFLHVKQKELQEDIVV